MVPKLRRYNDARLDKRSAYVVIPPPPVYLPHRQGEILSQQ